MTLPYIMSKDAITVMVNGAPATVREGQINFVTLRDAIRNRDWDAVPDLVNPKAAVERFATGRVTVQNGEVLLDGEVLHNAVTGRILDMVSEGFDADPLMKFLERLMQNPSRTAVNELYLWLEGTRLPITEDGCFMAYKKVNDSYRDFYTGKVLNKPAALMTDADAEYIKTTHGNVTVSVEDGVTTLTMPRNKVDDNRDRTCSYGLHFCSLSYLPCYHAKGRAMRYQVVGEHVQNEQTEAYATPVATAKGEARVSVRKAEPQAELSTWVLGVNFGTVERVAQVKALMATCVNQVGEARSVAQARVDGFDDAWYNKAADLHRYTHSHIREAVEYAQAYFEGYDRCRGNAPQVQVAVSEPVTAAAEFAPANSAQRDEILRVLNTPVTGNEPMHGQVDGDYFGAADGNKDRLNGRKFDLAAALRGGRGYRKAYMKAYTDYYNR